MSTNDQGHRLGVSPVGGPTVILELAGLRLITDPTFDPPQTYEPRPGVTLTKTAGPALAEDDVGEIDAVLLSHDQHKDNLDDAGRAFLTRVPQVFTTVSGAGRLGGQTTPLPNWVTVTLERPGGGTLEVTGVPAQHGPDGTEHLTGEVTGFVLAGDGLPTVYVSGDNASLDVVHAIVERLSGADVAVLFAGGAQLPYLGEEYLTLSNDGAVAAAQALGARAVVPVHVEGWAHFSQDRASLERAFADAGMEQIPRSSRVRCEDRCLATAASHELGPAHTGSIRSGSTNVAMLRTAVAVAPGSVEATLFDRLGALPHFNPDDDREGTVAPAAVAEIRAAIVAPDALLFCVPEYAGALPGSALRSDDRCE